MQNFLRLTKQAISRHGTVVTFKRVSVPVYNQFTGQATSTETNISIKVYPKQVVANQYNMPNMIGKELIDFYIYAPDVSSIAPKINDKLNLNSADYVVMRVREHRAEGAVVLYVVSAVKT